MATLNQSNGYWYVVETRNGERKYITPGYKLKSKAQEELEKYENDKEYYMPDSKMPLKALLMKYWEANVKRWSISELQNKKNEFKYILADVNFSNMPICRIHPEHVDNFFIEFEKRKSRLGKPYSPKTQKNVHQALNGAFNYAVKKELIGKNPCNIEAPTIIPAPLERTPETDWSDTFIGELLNNKEKSQMQLLAAIGILTGLRIGEVLALRDEDIDFKKKTISIRWTLKRLENNIIQKAKPGEVFMIFPEKTKNSKSKVVLKIVKTGNSVRTIAIDELLLSDIKKEIDKKKNKTNPLIFQTEKGEFLDPKTTSDNYKKWQTANNLPHIHFHKLRKYNTYFRLKATKDIKSTQADLGHKDSSITLKYYALVDDEARRSSANESFEYMRNLNKQETEEDNEVSDVDAILEKIDKLDEEAREKIFLSMYRNKK